MVIILRYYTKNVTFRFGVQYPLNCNKMVLLDEAGIMINAGLKFIKKKQNKTKTKKKKHFSVKKERKKGKNKTKQNKKP